MYHQYQNPFTVENWHIMYLFALKMISIWWPVLLFAAVAAYFCYREEQRALDRMRIRVPARKGPRNQAPKVGAVKAPK